MGAREKDGVHVSVLICKIKKKKKKVHRCAGSVR